MDGDMMVEVLKGLEAMPKPFEDYHVSIVTRSTILCHVRPYTLPPQSLICFALSWL
jgi:hypothetical protein